MLIIGWGLTWIRPGDSRRIGTAVQGFALLGTMVGLFTVAVGVGPRTTPDVVYHIAIIFVLVWGLRVAPPSADARSISSIVSRRAYLGEAYQGEVVNREAHEPLVSASEWEAAQSAFTAARA